MILGLGFRGFGFRGFGGFTVYGPSRRLRVGGPWGDSSGASALHEFSSNFQDQQPESLS